MKLILTRKADAFQKMAEDYYAMAVYNHALVIDKPYCSKKLKKNHWQCNFSITIKG